MDMAWPVLQMSSNYDTGGDIRPGGVSPDTGELNALDRKLDGSVQGFEGPEKTVEIEFDPDIGHEDGLRAVRREQWDAILEQVTGHALAVVPAAPSMSRADGR